MPGPLGDDDPQPVRNAFSISSTTSALQNFGLVAVVVDAADRGVRNQKLQLTAVVQVIAGKLGGCSAEKFVSRQTIEGVDSFFGDPGNRSTVGIEAD